MSYDNRPQAGQALQVRRPQWLIFLFLSAVFFVTFHDLSHAKIGIGNYDLSPDDLLGVVAAGTPARRIALLSLGIVAIASFACCRINRRLRINGALGSGFLCFAALAFLSPIWAVDLPLTFKKLVEFGILCIAAVAMVRRLSLRQIIFWTFFTTTIFLLIGVCAELVFGTFKPLASGYRFSGSLHPNGTGVECGLLLLSAVAAADVEYRWRAFFWICALMGLIFLILTGSRTSLAATLLGLVVYLAAVSSRGTKILTALTLILVIGFLLLFFGTVGLPSGLSSSILRGREDPLSGASLTDRTRLWEDLGHYIHQRPILGYGYCGFWSPTNIRVISDEEQWGVPNSHSAYVEYLLTLGTVGLAAYTFLLFAGIGRAFRFYRLSQNSAFAFCGALLVFCAVDGILESLIVEGSILQFLWMVVLARLAFVPLQRDSPVDT